MMVGRRSVVVLLLFLLSPARPIGSELIGDLFEESGEQTLLETAGGKESSEPGNFSHKSSRTEEDQSDFEVVLNPGPVLSPDVVLGHFVDYVPVSLHEGISGELGLSPNDSSSLNAWPESESSRTSSESIGEVREREEMGRSLWRVGRGSGPADVWDEEGPQSGPDNEAEEEADVEELSLLRNAPAHASFIKLNASRGTFRLDFSQDSVYLIVSPAKASRLVLSCDSIQLPNCTSPAAHSSLMVNNWGDIKFGRNSFVYCGPNSQVRTASLRRKIAVQTRKDTSLKGVAVCRFVARRPRFLEGEDNVCGKLGRSSKIVGGRQIEPGLFPYLVQLDITKNSGSHTTCSGSIISDRFILTAAHCLRSVESISVYMGGTDRNEFTGDELIVQAEKYILHRNWNSRTLEADIALVKLSRSIKFTEEISPVCLPDKRLRNENLYRKNGVAAGWGRISTERKAPRQAYRVRLPFLSDLRCFLAYRRFFRPKVMMCTASSLDSAICYGDSGGPLLYMRNKRVYQVGISSYSSSKVCGESFDVFTRLDDNYVSWINSRLQTESD